MATNMIVFFMLLSITCIRSQETNLQNLHDISIAVEEMQRANYFSFVMLLNMVSSKDTKFLGNVTFLMPKDKILSRTLIQENSVSEFLLRHSIPSPLLFEHLNLFPNGSIIPSSFPNYTLEISNSGRTNYHLNNVKIISRNICTLTSVKCHGIDGVLSLNAVNNDNNDTWVDHVSPPLPLSLPPVLAPSPANDQPHLGKSESTKFHLNSIIVTLILGFVVGVCV